MKSETESQGRQGWMPSVAESRPFRIDRPEPGADTVQAACRGSETRTRRGPELKSATLVLAQLLCGVRV